MDFVKQTIIEGTQYKNAARDENPLYISASMIGSNELQNFLTIVNEPIAETDITDATLGTILHKGMEAYVLEQTKKSTEPPLVEFSMKMILNNGWLLTGTADLITKVSNDHYIIHDYKFVKSYALKMYREDKQKAKHSYTLQMNALKLLFKNYMNSLGYENIRIDIQIHYFLKDANKMKDEPSYEIVYPPELSSEEMIDIVVEKTNSLNEYIINGEVPPECSDQDKWFRKVKGTAVPTRCMKYCSQGKAGNCKYYNPLGYHSIQNLAKGL